MARLSKSNRSAGQKDSGNNSNPSQKRHQRQRGHPDSDAKIVALSPSALMNEVVLFKCKLCPTDFVREQNLIVHTRGHHIPCNLKKNAGGSPRKKAYVCPIPTCRHHDPKHALSDITGIKKHYGRAHISLKPFGCTLCTKKYAVEADLKAHAKSHLKDGQGAGEARSSRARPEQVRCEGLEELTKAFVGGDSGAVVEGKEFVAAAAGSNNNGIGNDGVTTFPLGIGEQLRDVYVPQFDVAPKYQEKKEQGQAEMNVNALLDLHPDHLEHLPMGLTGLLMSCVAPGDKEAPASVGAANSAFGLDATFASAAATPTTVSGGGRGPVMSRRGAVLPTVNLSPSSSSYGARQSRNAVNRGKGMLESLCFPAGMEQYRTSAAPASGQKELPATESVQGAVVMVPNASVMTTGFLSSADALQMPRSVMIPSMGNYCYPEGVPNQQTMSTQNASFSSFAPFFGDAALMTTTMGDGFSDGFNGFFLGSTNTNQGSELGANSSTFLRIPSVCAPQQQQTATAPGLSYANILGSVAGTPTAASQMNQPWMGRQMAYTAPPMAVERAKRCRNGAGVGPRMDLFGASGEGTSRRFEEQGRGGTFDPIACFSGDLNTSFRGFW